MAGFEDRSGVVTLVVDRRIRHADVDVLCASIRPLLDRRPAGLVPVDVAALTRPDGVAIDALARLQLAARRRGQSIGLWRARPRLRELLLLAGLSDVLLAGERLRLERLGRAEEREQLRVEEAVDRGYPVV